MCLNAIDLRIGNVFQWYRNCSATVLMCSTSCSTSGGAPTKLTVNVTGSFSGAMASRLVGRDRGFDDVDDDVNVGRIRAIESSDSMDVSILLSILFLSLVFLIVFSFSL